VPTLTRFYGPIDWLARPIGILKAHLKMLPRLEASEALQARLIVAMGAGAMEEKDFKQIIGGWMNQAEGKTVAAQAPPKPRFNLAGMAASGIGVHGVKS